MPSKQGKVTIKKSRGGKCRVRIYGKNGELLHASQSLSQAQDARRNIEATRKVLNDPATKYIDEVTKKK